MWNRREDRREAVFGFEGTERIILDSSAVEHSAVNRRVVGSNPTRGVPRLQSGLAYKIFNGKREEGSMVKRLRHRPFTAVTRVRFPLESYGDIAKW